MAKTLLYIHGIRDDDPGLRWRETLDQTLSRHGVETLGGRGYEILNPSYLEILEADDVPKTPPPDETYVRSGDAAYDLAARTYYVALSRLERELGESARFFPGPMGRFPAERFAGAAMRLTTRFADAVAYVTSADRRNAILRRLLEDVPPESDLVVVGHSLGSIVAADLLYFLPAQSRVLLFVTMGSPIALRPLRSHLLRIGSRFPFERIGPWLNVVGDADAVTAGDGISDQFPEVLDVFVDSGMSQKTAHSAAMYLDQDVIGRALAWADHRADVREQEASVPDTTPGVVLPAVVRAQYLLRLEQRLDAGKVRDRFAKARAHLARSSADAMRAAGHEHSLLDRLLLDNEMALGGKAGRHEGLAMLVLWRMSNPVEPFVIEVPDKARRSALEELALDLGLPRRWARCVIAAEEDARSAHSDGALLKKKIALAAVGVVAIAAAPILVMAAAPAGLAGGAGIVAGLAALGPGGMMGGLGVVGALGGAGGAAVATGLTAGTAAEVESNVVFLQMLALASSELQCAPSGSPEWRMLHEMRTTVEAGHEFLAQHSDDDAPPLRALELKLRAVSAALTWFSARGLAPTSLTA